MAINIELSVRLREILTAHERPSTAIEKLRELQAVEVADFVRLASHSQDLGEIRRLIKSEQGTPEPAPRTKMVVGSIWCDRLEAFPPSKTSDKRNDESDSDDSADDDCDPNTQLCFCPTVNAPLIFALYSMGFARDAGLTPHPSTDIGANLPKTAQTSLRAFGASRAAFGYRRNH